MKYKWQLLGGWKYRKLRNYTSIVERMSPVKFTLFSKTKNLSTLDVGQGTQGKFILGNETFDVRERNSLFLRVKAKLRAWSEYFASRHKKVPTSLENRTNLFQSLAPTIHAVLGETYYTHKSVRSNKKVARHNWDVYICWEPFLNLRRCKSLRQLYSRATFFSSFLDEIGSAIN